MGISGEILSWAVGGRAGVLISIAVPGAQLVHSERDCFQGILHSSIVISKSNLCSRPLKNDQRHACEVRSTIIRQNAMLACRWKTFGHIQRLRVALALSLPCMRETCCLNRAATRVPCRVTAGHRHTADHFENFEITADYDMQSTVASRSELCL